MRNPKLTTLLVKEARQIIGGLGEPSKMPGLAYGLPAWACQTGAKLAKIPGSACADCYVNRINSRYQTREVKSAHQRRLASLTHPLWVEAMITAIASGCRNMPYFRWHDSGDIQSLDHLLKIIAIAWALPHIRFWLPTQERGYVLLAKRLGVDFPENLVIRLSATKLDVPAALAAAGFPQSSIRSQGPAPAGAYQCPAPQQGNSCGECRACWSPDVRWVSYRKH